MTTDIYYVTYPGDYGWFKQSLAVLRKNLTGYRNINVVLQGVSGPTDGTMVLPDVDDPTGIFWHFAPGWEGLGYYAQQYLKMTADKYSDADLIMMVDSDVFITKPVHVDDFLVDGKPCWMWTMYEELGKTVPWQKPTEKATGMPCDREFMRGMPFVLHNTSLRSTRSALEFLHGKPLEGIIKEAAPAGFSEFNVMGRMSWEHEHDRYHWFDPAKEVKPKGLAATEQFWSRAPVEDHMQAIQNILDGVGGGGLRTTRMAHWIIDGDTHISRWVEQTGRLDHDQDLLPRILERINPGDVVVDVGAFIGDHTFAYGNATRGVDSGRVFAFEPNPLPFEALTRNMVGHGHVVCINKGLSNNAGKMGLERTLNAGASYMVPGEDVEVTTLDSYDLQKCDLIKIDAEGQELNVLMGAWKTIERHHPVLVLEINRGALARNGVHKDDIYVWLKLRGYDIAGDEDGEQFDVFATWLPAGVGGLEPGRYAYAMRYVEPNGNAPTNMVGVLGVSHKDSAIAVQWMRWVAFLSHDPRSQYTNQANHLYVVTTAKVPSADLTAMKKAALRYNGHVQFLTLPTQMEVGYPKAANHLFLNALTMVGERYSGAPLLWIEPDAIPVKPAWLALIDQEYRACGKPFMGHLEDKHYTPHMAGVAVYPHNWRELAPKLDDCLNAPDGPTFRRGRGTPFDTYAGDQVLQQAAQSTTIQQVWKAPPFGPEQLSLVKPETALFHQSKDGRLIWFLSREKYPAFHEPPWK